MFHNRLTRSADFRGLVHFILVTALIATLTLSAQPAPAAHAASIPVTTCNASDLINAINTANGNSESDTITLTAGCTYTLTAPNNYWYGPTGLPPITSIITINGNGATILRNTSSTNFRLFYVGGINVPTGTLTLQNLTLKNGLAQGGGSSGTYGGGGGGMGAGGAILTRAICGWRA